MTLELVYSVLKKLLPTALLTFLLAILAFGQTSRGTVTGEVTDNTGAVISAATVELTNKGTNQTRSTTTNDSGIYRFDAVDLGTYDLKISVQGFKTFTATNIEIQANRIATFDAKLDTSGADIVIAVNAGTEEILQKSDAVHGGNFDHQEITKLPTASLSAYDLGRLVPGASTATGSGASFGNGTSQFAINGQRPRGNNYLLDGTENNDISIGGPANEITNDDAIAEFSIQTGLFSAEFGRAGGGVFNVITKSGTNQFHGTGRWLILSQDFNATTNGDRLNGLTSPSVFTENIFGGTIGGPIIKDKTFFFAAAQWDRFRSTANFGPFFVPTASGLARLNQLFPSGSNARVDLYRSAFAGLVGVSNPTMIPLGKDPVTGVDRGAVEFGSIGVPSAQQQNDRQIVGHVDHVFNENHRLSVRYLIDDNILTPDAINNPGFFFNFQGRSQNLLGTYTWVINPTMTNEFRFSYGKINFEFPIGNGNPAATTEPAIAISGISGFGIQTNIPQFRIADNYLFQETMTKVVRTHTLRYGAEILRQIAQQAPPFNSRGSFGFNSGGGFSGFGNFIDNFSGQSGTANINFGNPIYHPNLLRQSYFFQDTWKMFSNFTLTLGLRYENFGQPANTAFKFPAFAGFDPANFLIPNKVNSDNNNFAPVVGFAWSPNPRSGVFNWLFGEGKTVWRGGYQISYDTFFNNMLSNIAADSPNTISTTFVGGSGRGSSGFFPTAIPTTARVPTPFDSQNSVFSPNIRNPYTQRWSLGFQRQLSGGMLLDVSYIGTVGRKLFYTEDLNPLVNGHRLFTDLGIRRVRDSGANSSYNSLQVRLDKRFSHGFQINASYTYSKFIDNISEIFGTTSSNTSLASVPTFQGGLSLDRAVSDYDRPQRLVIAYIWDLPGPKHGILEQALGGWEIAGITSFQSGAPYTILNGLDRNGDGLSGGDRPDIGNPNMPHNTRAVIDSSCGTGFRNPDTGGCVSRSQVYVVQGVGFPNSSTLGRNTERTKGVNDFDMTAFKVFQINERFRLEYRVEAFNVFNHPQFTNVPGRSVVATPAAQFGDFINLTNAGGRTMRMGLKLVF